MDLYIGTKTILAAPMTRGEYNKYRNWIVPENENPDDKGYLVEYVDAGDKNHPNHDNYISWSPKKTFDASYRPVTGLTFGAALEAMKKGFKISRSGWNKKGMFVVYQKGYPHGIPCNAQTAQAFGLQEGDLFRCRPYMQLRCADGSHQMWQPTVSDCLEEDWFLIQ